MGGKEEAYHRLCDETQAKQAIGQPGTMLKRFTTCDGALVLAECFSDGAAFASHLKSDYLANWFKVFTEMSGEPVRVEVFGDVDADTAKALADFKPKMWPQKAGFSRF